MRVLVACEFSGRVREAFRRKGHDAWSCDLEPTEIPGNHIQQDVRSVLGNGWDLLIGHPPCTYLAASGARWWKVREREQKERFKELLQEELEKRNIFQMTELLREIEPMIAWWNGTSTMPAYYKKPAEMYADAFSVWINNPAAVARMAPKYYWLS